MTSARLAHRALPLAAALVSVLLVNGKVAKRQDVRVT
jgi:hypothetical protein